MIEAARTRDPRVLAAILAGGAALLVGAYDLSRLAYVYGGADVPLLPAGIACAVVAALILMRPGLGARVGFLAAAGVSVLAIYAKVVEDRGFTLLLFAAAALMWVATFHAGSMAGSPSKP